jgi:hypothetical protein
MREIARMKGSGRISALAFVGETLLHIAGL